MSRAARNVEPNGRRQFVRAPTIPRGASSAFWRHTPTTTEKRKKKKTHTHTQSGQNDELSLPFLLHRLLRLLLNLHFTWPLWAPDARPLFPSTDAISAAAAAAAAAAAENNNLGFDRARWSLGVCLVLSRIVSPSSPLSPLSSGVELRSVTSQTNVDSPPFLYLPDPDREGAPRR